MGDKGTIWETTKNKPRSRSPGAMNYHGLISWEGNIYEGEHEPIIDEVTFKRAPVLLADRRRIAASKPFPFKSRKLLTGLMRCANCVAF